MGARTGATPSAVSVTHGSWRSSSLWTLTSSETRSWVLELAWGPVRCVCVWVAWVCCCRTDCIMREHCFSSGSKINSEPLHYSWAWMWDLSQQNRNNKECLLRGCREWSLLGRCSLSLSPLSECCISIDTTVWIDSRKGTRVMLFNVLKVHWYSVCVCVCYSTPWLRCGFRKHQRWTPVSSITAAHSWATCWTSETWS